jgi:hypothetical protein
MTECKIIPLTNLPLAIYILLCNFTQILKTFHSDMQFFTSNQQNPIALHCRASDLKMRGEFFRAPLRILRGAVGELFLLID